MQLVSQHWLEEPEYWAEHAEQMTEECWTCNINILQQFYTRFYRHDLMLKYSICPIEVFSRPKYVNV